MLELLTPGELNPIKVAPFPFIVMLLSTYIQMSVYVPDSKFNVSPSDMPLIVFCMVVLLDPARIVCWEAV